MKIVGIKNLKVQKLLEVSHYYDENHQMYMELIDTHTQERILFHEYVDINYLKEFLPNRNVKILNFNIMVQAKDNIDLELHDVPNHKYILDKRYILVETDKEIRNGDFVDSIYTSFDIYSSKYICEDEDTDVFDTDRIVEDLNCNIYNWNITHFIKENDVRDYIINNPEDIVINIKINQFHSENFKYKDSLINFITEDND